MCGIAGIFKQGFGPDDERALRRMTAALAPRGPDGEGFYLDSPIGLGHRRLAIIDVAGGHQPLHSEQGEVSVVVNGEIYNFRSLRKELEALGHRFATHSDSEVIVHGYEVWGTGVISRLEGMFALAIWDKRNQTLVLARDRMGEKPLFYAETPGGGLAFSSELKSLRHAPGVDDRIDPRSLARYLVYEFVPAPRTILRGSHKLAPGTMLVKVVGQPLTIESYWDLPLPTYDEARISEEDVAEELLLAELRRAVEERLVSDVPLGVFLSGGIDSSCVAALAAEVRGHDLDTFSIGFDDPTFDESAHARTVATAIGSRHHEQRVTASALLDLLPSIGRLLDEPLGDGSIVPTHLLARFARKKVTVALGGDGGDELFLGYPTFVAERAGRAIEALPAPLRASLVGSSRQVAKRLPVSLGYLSFDFKVKQFLRGAHLPGALRHQAWLGSLLPEQVDDLMPGRPSETDDLFDATTSRLRACPSDDPWDRLLYVYAKGYLGDQVLTKVDRATMAVGLESRAPLLDTKVIALACRIAPNLKLRGKTTKYILRRAVRKLLPGDILARKKQGFGMPIGRWLMKELRPLLEDELSASVLANDGLFSPAAVRRLVDEHLSGKADHRKPLWTLLAFQAWYRDWRATS